MADENNKDNAANPKELSDAEQAIIEILKKQSMGQPILTQQIRPDAAAQDKKHAFWKTQPMNHNGSSEEGPVEEDKSVDEIRQEPYKMPAGFTWCSVDIQNPEQKKELYDLLAGNYVEDDDCLFRFDYSQDFLEWALTAPSFALELLLGVRAQKSGRLVAFISGIPATVRVRDRSDLQMVEINFLCVHKKLRSKRLAPVLIKEITRRTNLRGVFQAVYTAGVVLPVPVARARYHHRSLNPKKLVSVGFSRLGPRMTLARLQKLYKLPTETSTKGLRPMEPKDVPGVHKLLTNYLAKFPLSIVFDENEVAHWLLPRKGVVDAFVVENTGGEITDLCSFYHLNSTILNKNESLYAAYSFYNVATSVQWSELMRDCLILAKNGGADVFNALNLMENDQFLSELKFGLGDGFLQYYLYNWRTQTMNSNEVGIVLL